ncbi:hypothetical protein V8G54_005161 [Vigna mungo]|uniref:Uncharacterized protein n=1 Tax=Vigna mungo TaxID=3915 RepID=A0AAQ3PJK0_VIGMU
MFEILYCSEGGNIFDKDNLDVDRSRHRNAGKTSRHRSLLRCTMAVKTPGVAIIRLKSAFLCFSNANSVREDPEMDHSGRCKGENRRHHRKHSSARIASLEELHESLVSSGKQLAIANPGWQVIYKLKATNFVARIGGRVFLTIGEAIDCNLDF